MEVKAYFPTPIWRENITIKDKWKDFAFDYFEKNSILSNSQNKKLKHSQSVGTYSNSEIEKNFKSNDILRLSEFHDLKIVIRKALEECFAEYYGDEANNNNEVIMRESWLNKCDKSGFQYCHNHGNSLLSYTLYINYDFKKGHTPLYFERPNFNTSPFFSIESWTKWTAQRNILYEIMEGDLVVWPSYLMHGFFTNKGDNRITLSGNALLRSIFNKAYSFELKS